MVNSIKKKNSLSSVLMQEGKTNLHCKILEVNEDLSFCRIEDIEAETPQEKHDLSQQTTEIPNISEIVQTEVCF